MSTQYSLALDHPLDAPNLALDAAQPPDQDGLIARVGVPEGRIQVGAVGAGLESGRAVAPAAAVERAVLARFVLSAANCALASQSSAPAACLPDRRRGDLRR